MQRNSWYRCSVVFALSLLIGAAAVSAAMPRDIAVQQISLASPSGKLHRLEYKVVQELSLAPEPGKLQILEDARLTPENAQDLWEYSIDPYEAFGEDSELAKEFRQQPMLAAKLRLIDAKGEELQGFVIAPDNKTVFPVARIDGRKFGDTILVTDSGKAIQGSYNGWTTFFYKIQGGAIHQVMAVDDIGQAQPILIWKSGKSDWRIVREGNEPMIHFVLCFPDFIEEAPPDRNLVFHVYLRSYRRQNGVWHVAERKVPGFWESDQEFPDASQFPDAQD